MTALAPPTTAPTEARTSRQSAVLLRDLIRCFALDPDGYKAPPGVTYRDIVDAYTATVREVNASPAGESYISRNIPA